MSIALQNRVDELERRLAALEERVGPGPAHVWELTASGGQPIIEKPKTLTLPEKRKSA
jgi:hypothetical protein